MIEKYAYTKTYDNYGKVVITLNKILEKRNIKPYRLSMLTGINCDIIKRYAKGNLYRVDLEILAKICYVLECPLDDIIHYEQGEITQGENP